MTVYSFNKLVGGIFATYSGEDGLLASAMKLWTFSVSIPPMLLARPASSVIQLGPYVEEEGDITRTFYGDSDTVFAALEATEVVKPQDKVLYQLDLLSKRSAMGSLLLTSPIIRPTWRTLIKLGHSMPDSRLQISRVNGYVSNLGEPHEVTFDVVLSDEDIRRGYRITPKRLELERKERETETKVPLTNTLGRTSYHCGRASRTRARESG